MWTQTQAFKSARNTLPLSNWTVAIAAAAGLLIGSKHLAQSLDLATAVGIAHFLSIAIGGWLAFRLYRWLIRGYTGWLSKIQARADAMTDRLSVAKSATEPAADDASGISLVTRLVAQSLYLTLAGCGAFTTSFLSGIMMTQLDGNDYGSYFVWGAVAFGVVAVSVVVQCLYFWRLHRTVVSVERLMGKATAVPQVTGRTAILEVSITRTERLGRRFIGMGSTSEERAAV